MITQLKQYLTRYVAFTEEELNLIYAQFTRKTFDKKSFLLQEGQTCSYYYFITEGLIRTFYTTPKGHERITQFAIEDWWVTEMESFIMGVPSYYSMQALAKTEVLQISKVALEELYGRVPKMERLFRLITQKRLIASQRREDIFAHMTSKERYLSLVEGFPDFAQRVPQYMIASYLEITPEYLSELRKTLH